MNLAALQLRNAARWFAANAITWVLLSSIYSLTVAILLQTIIERLQGAPAELAPIWLMSMLLLLIPGALEKLPLPNLPFQLSSRRLFSQTWWTRLGGSSLLPLYLRHELRRPQTWLTLVITVTLGALLPDAHLKLWIFIAQLPLQRALWSIGGWRRIALRTPDGPSEGATLLLTSFLWSQLIQGAVALLALLCARALENGTPAPDLAPLAAAQLASIFGCAAVTMEGDSGRPWLVNFAGLSAGIIAASVTLWQPALLLLAVYAFSNLKLNVKNRLWSVEEFDEDSLLS